VLRGQRDGSLRPYSWLSRPITSPLQNESEIQFLHLRNHITSPLQNESEIQFLPHRNHITSPLQNESEIQFLPHRNHITSPLQNESEIQFVPHRNHITSPLQIFFLDFPIYLQYVEIHSITFSKWCVGKRGRLQECSVAPLRNNRLKGSFFYFVRQKFY
jgi:hypothetical protein